MIQLVLLSCSTSIVNTLIVVIPIWSINQNRNRSSSQSSLQTSWRLSYWSIFFRIKTIGSSTNSTLSLESNIRILRTLKDTKLGCVCNSLLRPSTTTSIWLITIVLSYTIKKLLFRELKKFSAFDGIERFENTSCCESPTWATCSLIFDWSYNTFCSPIDRNRNTRLKRSKNLFFMFDLVFIIACSFIDVRLWLRQNVIENSLFEFFIWHIRELIQTNFICCIFVF